MLDFLVQELKSDISENLVWNSFVQSVQEAIDFMTKLSPSVNQLELERFGKALIKIGKGDVLTPDSCFEEMGCGCFKECYSSGVEGFIIKFCSESNQTDAEEEILAKADCEGVGEFFLPSFYSPLPRPCNSVYLDTDCDYDEEYCTDCSEYQQLCEFVVQPLVTLSCYTDFLTVPLQRSIYEANSLYYEDGERIEFMDVRNTGITDLSWMDAVSQSGKKKFQLFITFLKEQGISDLHTENIGWWKKDGVNRPVILDWLSCRH